MTRIVEFLVALNAIGGVLTYLGIRWGVRRVRGRLAAAANPDDRSARADREPSLQMQAETERTSHGT